MTIQTKVLIIGSGPAGYTAAIYTSRAGLEPVLFSGPQIGGQLTLTNEIENFPGFPDPITGEELMFRMREQCQKLGVNIIHDEIVSIDFKKRPFTCKTSSKEEVKADSIIISTGATAKLLNLNNEIKYLGHGISTCATCDGFFYKGKDVAVVGGGNTAAMEAMHLSKFCKTVYMIHRRDKLKADKVMQKRLLSTKNISMVWNSTPVSISGTDNPPSLTTVTLRNLKTNEDTDLKVDGLFISIGSNPETKLFKNQLDLDESGYIITKPQSCKTSIDGVFAAGDVQNPLHKQAILAAGSGCLAALEAEEFLSDLN
ncbi:MAG: thioredoxin-disulfide reductase [Lactobacillus sp.]|jgi:thioredoxin reductase (NADPH)|nr:thioredoxin-disulfide reductase [Lactobacillus sp.]